MRRLTGILFVAFTLFAGLYGALRTPWPGRDFLSPEDRAWLQANYQHITVAPDPRWLPDQQIREQQIYQGISEDFMSLVERKLGVRFLRLYTESWEQTLALEQRGEIDIHPVLFKTEARSDDWLFTAPYMRIPVIAVMRSSLKDTFHPAQMWRLRISVGRGYGIESFLQQHAGEQLQLVPVESDRFGMIKAALGEVDVMVTDLASASYYIEQEGLTNLRLAATLGTMYEFRFASRRDKPELNGILNKALAQISREERRRIYDRWIVFDARPFYQSRSFWYTAGGVLLLVLLVLTVILGWNAALQVEVESKTRALQQAQRELERRVERRTAQLAAANRALEAEMRERAQTAHDLLQVSGNERARIGRDLHDSMGQKLVGALYLCRALSDRLSDRADEDAAAAGRIATVVDEAINDMKQIVRGVLPVDILDKGLVAALAALVKESASFHGVDCRFVCEDEDACSVEDNALATHLYRVVQEAIGNAVKHAGNLHTVTVTLTVRDGEGLLQIDDDGDAPFDVANAGKGMGLKIMRYRALLAGGRLDIEKRPQGGTSVICRFDPAEKRTEAEVV